MSEITMRPERITRGEIEMYKREVLEQSVLVTPKDAASVLACSTRTVYSLVQEGKISAHNGSRRSKGLRILAASLKEYVQSIKLHQGDFGA